MQADLHRRRYHSVGHIWQGRFKAFPIHGDGHLLSVVRYVNRNALRAGLVTRAEAWPSGSLSARIAGRPSALSGGLPLPLSAHWVERVNGPESVQELIAIRRCVQRGAPFGDPVRTLATVKALGLEYSMRSRGRPPRASAGTYPCGWAIWADGNPRRSRRSDAQYVH